MDAERIVKGQDVTELNRIAAREGLDIKGNATVGEAAPTVPGGLDQSRLSHLVGYAATRASVELKKTFRRHLGPLRLKAVEFSILVLVASNERVNQKQLGQALEVSAPNMAITLDRMVLRGWVERVRSTVDRRAQLIHLTEAGRALCARAERIAATMEHDAVSVLTRGEQLMLIELLHKVARG